MSEPPNGPKPAGGYGRPPVEHQFKKGASGNPKGRPRKPPPPPPLPPGSALMSIVLAEANRPIHGHDGTTPVSMTAMQALVRATVAKAIKGDTSAAKLFVKLAAQAQQDQYELIRDEFMSLAEYKEQATAAVEHARKTGRPPPDVTPHPNDIVIDYSLAEVIFNGPRNSVEKREWEKARADRRETLDSISSMNKLKLDDPSPGFHQFCDEEIAFLQLKIEVIDANFPDEQTRRTVGFDLRVWRAERRRILKARLESQKSKSIGNESD